MSQSLQLGISYQGGEREYVPVRHWPFSIGRNPDNDLCLSQSNFVSRCHARLLQKDATVKLVACGSNPTFLNGALVAPDAPVDVTPGDRIELPNYLIEVAPHNGQATAGATVDVESTSTSAVIVRRIAASLHSSQWTAGAVVEWLEQKDGREIRIHQDPAALFLTAGISLDEFMHRLALLEKLIDPLDPYTLGIEITDPGCFAIEAY